MEVEIKKIKIEKKPENLVTSHLIYEPHRRKNNAKFDDNGIFSKRIFGNFNTCDCLDENGRKIKREPGICPICGTRIITLDDIPDFYTSLGDGNYVLTSLPTFPDEVRNKFINYINSIMSYKAFILLDNSKNGYHLEYIITDKIEDEENDKKKDELIINAFNDFQEANYNQDLVFIGLEAVRKLIELENLSISDEWIELNIVDYIKIPHPIYRPIIKTNNNNIITEINNLYSDLIKKVNDLNDYNEYSDNNKFIKMSQNLAISEVYRSIINQLFNELQDVKYSIIKSEIISHPISGAIRGVLINRSDIDEDTILIGDTFIETLFPYLYKKFKGNLVKIDQEIQDRNYKVILNRPPTICELSAVGFKPRIMSVYDGIKSNNNTNIDIERMNTEWNYGDIERYLDVDNEDGRNVDTSGIRCIAINAIAADGEAADFDGDVLLAIALYSDAANEEAEYMLASKNYINYANGTIRNHIIDNFIYPLKD